VVQVTDGDGTSWDADFGVEEWHCTNAFIHDGSRVFGTYFINSGDDEALGRRGAFST
jgi:hypothetical protein